MKELNLFNFHKGILLFRYEGETVGLLLCFLCENNYKNIHFNVLHYGKEVC